MPVEVCARVACDDPELDDTLERAAAVLLDALGHAACELDISLVDDVEMRDINLRHRGKDRSTDVLSFAQLEGEALASPGAPSFVDPAERPSEQASQHLGDIVISLDTAARQAAHGGWTLQEECARLCLHGLLHLVGHDHEQGGVEAERMQAEEERLIGVLAEAGIACAHDQA